MFVLLFVFVFVVAVICCYLCLSVISLQLNLLVYVYVCINGCVIIVSVAALIITHKTASPIMAQLLVTKLLLL